MCQRGESRGNAQWGGCLYNQHSMKVNHIGPYLPYMGHPSTHRMQQLFHWKYWWPNMLQDINKFVTSCSVCAQAKVPRTLLWVNSYHYQRLNDHGLS